MTSLEPILLTHRVLSTLIRPPSKEVTLLSLLKPHTSNNFIVTRTCRNGLQIDHEGNSYTNRSEADGKIAFRCKKKKQMPRNSYCKFFADKICTYSASQSSPQQWWSFDCSKIFWIKTNCYRSATDSHSNALQELFAELRWKWTSCPTLIPQISVILK